METTHPEATSNSISSLTLDYTSLTDYRRCPRRFYYRYAQNLVGAETSDALAFGSLVHAGLELLYSEQCMPPVNSAAVAEMGYLASGEFPGGHIPNDPFAKVLQILAIKAAAQNSPCCNKPPQERRSLKHLFVLLQRYLENYIPDHIHPIAYEQTHTMLLGESHGLRSINVPVYLRGTIDMREIDRIVENKTTSFIGTSFLDRIHPNDQATAYCLLASDIVKEPVRKILFNGISTSGFGLKSAELGWPIHKDPSHLFLRAETHRTEAEIEDFTQRALNTAHHILCDLDKPAGVGPWNANPPDACTMFNSVCEYAHLCRSPVETHATLIPNLYRIEEWRNASIVRKE